MATRTTRVIVLALALTTAAFVSFAVPSIAPGGLGDPCPPGYHGQIILGGGTCCEDDDANGNGIPHECYEW